MFSRTIVLVLVAATVMVTQLGNLTAMFQSADETRVEAMRVEEPVVWQSQAVADRNMKTVVSIATPSIDETTEVRVILAPPQDYSTLLEPMSMEPMSMEPMSMEPMSMEPMSVEPMSMEPISAEPISADPTNLQSDSALVADQPSLEIDLSSPNAAQVSFAQPTPVAQQPFTITNLPPVPDLVAAQTSLDIERTSAIAADVAFAQPTQSVQQGHPFSPTHFANEQPSGPVENFYADQSVPYHSNHVPYQTAPVSGYARVPAHPALNTSNYSLTDYRRMMRNHPAPHPHELQGMWRGVNKGIATVAIDKRFIKEFTNVDGQIYGDNIEVKEGLSYKPIQDTKTGGEKRTGKFLVQCGRGVGAFKHALILNYRQGGNRKIDPANLIFDRVVKLDDNHMLGRATAKFGPMEIPLSYFVLQRMPQ